MDKKSFGREKDMNDTTVKNIFIGFVCIGLIAYGMITGVEGWITTGVGLMCAAYGISIGSNVANSIYRARIEAMKEVQEAVLAKTVKDIFEKNMEEFSKEKTK